MRNQYKWMVCCRLSDKYPDLEIDGLYHLNIIEGAESEMVKVINDINRTNNETNGVKVTTRLTIQKEDIGLFMDLDEWQSYRRSAVIDKIIDESIP